MFRRMLSIALMLGLTLTQTACYTVTQSARPASYCAENADGNQCKNECMAQYRSCEQSATFYERDDDGNKRRQTDEWRMVECEQSRRSCYADCAQYHGGEYTPPREEKKELDGQRTGILAAIIGGLLVIGLIQEAVSPDDDSSDI